MLLLEPQLSAQRRPILCIGAHCDDIEIGCGGTLRRLVHGQPTVQCVWAIFSGDRTREFETRHAAESLLQPTPELIFFDFPESFFPGSFDRIKHAFDNLKARVDPSMVFTHCLQDRHQDHALLAELSWNTFRNHFILEYEIAKYEGDLGHPNVFAPMSVDDLNEKTRVLMECFPSQRMRSWFTEDTFRGVARLRGIECASPTGFAEAFHGRKICI